MSADSRTGGSGGMRGEAQGWLPTYAALGMALLLFFVALYSISVREKRLLPQPRQQGLASWTGAFYAIRAFIVQNGMEADIEAVQDAASISLRLSEGKLFSPGTEQILPTGLNILNRLKDLFLIHDWQTIAIRAYADDSPLPPGSRFRDSWELSAIRAAQVQRHLLAQGVDPGSLSATGFGELEPLFPNTSEENRAKNRRVEFVLERQP